MNFYCWLTNHDTFFCYAIEYQASSDIDQTSLDELVPVNRIQAFHAKQCACGLTVGDGIWRVDQLVDNDTDRTDLSSYEHLQRSTLVKELQAPIHGREIYLLVEGHPGLRARHTKTPHSIFAPTNKQVSIMKSDVDYASAMADPTVLVVDKSRFVSPDILRLLHYCPGMIPLLRRPPGFGKTMLLSLFECCLGIGSTFVPTKTPDEIAFRSALLPEKDLGLVIVHLDLEALDVSSPNELQNVCTTFLTKAAIECYNQNRCHFPPDSTPRNFAHLMSMGEDLNLQFFLGIDNYTAPLSRATSATRSSLEDPIIKHIFHPVLRAVRSGHVIKGIIVGCDIPNIPDPYHFDRSGACVFDHSDSPRLFHMLGLSEVEIVLIGEALFGAGHGFLHEVRSATTLFSTDDSPFPRLDRGYSMRDVFEIMRAYPNATSNKTVAAIQYNRPLTRIHASFMKRTLPQSGRSPLAAVNNANVGQVTN